MFEINNFIVYEKRGVCKVIGIKTEKNTDNNINEEYYVLKQAFKNYTIYAPVEEAKFMRPVISAENAEELINKIPALKPKAFYNDRFTELRRHYEKYFQNNDCADLIELVMSISAKKKAVENQNKKFGQTDKKYLDKAEELLYSEFAVALGIPKEKVRKYILSRVSDIKRKADKNKKIS